MTEIPVDWQEIDLRPYLEGKIIEHPPTMLARSDGVKLFYPRKVTWVSGLPESGKSWFTQILIAETIMSGEHAVVVDHETDGLPIVNRLRALGCSDDAIADRLHYFRPESPLKFADAIIACAAKFAPVVIVIDGVAAAMGTSAFDGNKAGDFYAWWALLGGKLRGVAPDAAVVCVDHVTKSAETRGVWAVGTGQKLAAVDVHYGFELREPIGRGMVGYSNVWLLKDKPGWLKRHMRSWSADHGAIIAKQSMQANGDGDIVRYKIGPPTDDAATFRPTVLMGRVSAVMAFAGLGTTPMSKRAIIDMVKGNASAVRLAVDILTREGYLVATPKGKFLVYTHARSYAAEDEPGQQLGIEDEWRSASECVRGASGTQGGESASMRPTPKGGRTRTRTAPGTDPTQNGAVSPGRTADDWIPF